MLDTSRSIETPEGIELTLRIAGPIARALAWLMDFGIRCLLYLILLLTLPHFGNLGIGVLLISFFLIEWFYPVFFEVYRNGATPGKKAMKIKVLYETGIPINWSASMIRNLLRVIDFLPLFYGFGLITMLINKDFKRIGDLAAGTLVVYEEEILFTNTKLPNLIANQKPSFPTSPTSPLILPVDAQQAIIKLIERAPQLRTERLIELANIIAPLTGKRDEEAIQYLQQLANSLIGEEPKSTT
jgi:uncharacterized RDD family membrane protein YckC